MKTITTIVLGLALAGVAHAEKYSAVTPEGKEVVAHTRLAPVIVHRVLPPYGLGRHVYAGRTAVAPLSAAPETR